MKQATHHDSPVAIPSSWFFAFCGLASIFLLALGHSSPFPAWLCAVEVCLTVLGLFIFGSIRYRLDKNALTYGACAVITSTFWWTWWNGSILRRQFETEGWIPVGHFIARYALTLDGLNQLIHADMMLFILGLTLFVAIIAQTRLLEAVSFLVLRKTDGNVVMTVSMMVGLVAFFSAILGGVSMVGLLIRTLVIILALAKQKDDAVIYAVIVSTIVTTVCGMWLSYGEPPNLIMQVNLRPHLSDYFFLVYCLPVALGSFGIVLWNVHRRLDGKRIDISTLNRNDSTGIDFQKAQKIGVLSFFPFVGLLVWHSFDSSLPLFWASFAGFGCAFAGLASLSKARDLALREAKAECLEYLFLLPLFFSIMLLQKSGFFNQLSSLLKSGIEHVGVGHMAFLQFWCATILSAMLDNNIVADFAARALHGLDLGTMRVFAMSQIAGYGLGGCWTHVGSAQSVVAYAFILKEVNERFTPFQWIKEITPVILQISVWIAVVVYGEAWLLSFFKG